MMSKALCLAETAVSPQEEPRRRGKFRCRRRSDTSKRAEHLIDLASKPMCLIKLIDFFFKILNDPIPNPNPKPNPYKNRIKVKKDKKKSLTKFKNKKKPRMGLEPLPNP